MNKPVSVILTGMAFVFYSFPLAAQAPPAMRDTGITGPQTFAMIVGISTYKYVRPLQFADKDAELFRAFLQSPGGGHVPAGNIFNLLNEQATSSNFWSKGFQWMRAKKLRQGDKLFIYLAGHGDAIDEDQYFFISHDCNPGGDKNNYLAGGTIQLYNLKKKIAAETAKGVEVIFIMDACRTNELPGGTEGLNFLNTAISEKKTGEIMMLATAAGQESLEDASIGNGHGLFTWYLVDGLSGMADLDGGPDLKITFREIRQYVDRHVPDIARQQFKKEQEPFFCCNEFSEKVISTVDAAYLQKWMKETKRSGGNSFSGIEDRDNLFFNADTLLIETYNRFNEAVRNKKINGPSSAEDYYQQLDKKFPGNPYTLDAMSTLAMEYINAAQQKMNLYFSCQDDLSADQKKQNFELGLNLEKAISLLQDDEPDYAATLRAQMLFWKASGDFGQGGVNGDMRAAMAFAHQSLAEQPDGAFILNRLALLHLQDNARDSALYYAERAARLAPKWTCALATLKRVQESATSPSAPSGKRGGKGGFGVTVGGGLNRSNPDYSGNPNTGFTGVESQGAVVAGAGINYNVPLGNAVSVRPEVNITTTNTSVDFLVRVAGEPTARENVPVKTTNLGITLPFVVNFTPGEKVNPYLRLGATYSIVLSQDQNSASRLPVKKSLAMGETGLGADIRIPKTSMVISPEIKYIMGFSDMNDDSAGTPFTQSLSGLKRNAFTLNVYLSWQ